MPHGSHDQARAAEVGSPYFEASKLVEGMQRIGDADLMDFDQQNGLIARAALELVQSQRVFPLLSEV